MHARSGLVALAVLSFVGPAQAEVDYRLHSTYLSSRLANGRFRTSDQVLECRTLFHLGLDRSLVFLGQLQREEDFEQRVHAFRGRGDLQFRSTPLDLYFRNRPDQRVSINQPPGWKLNETSWGGQLHKESLPNLRFESTSRERRYGGANTIGNPNNTQVDEQRLSVAQRLRGIDFDYSDRWQDSNSQRTIGGIPIPGSSAVRRRTRETQFGAEAQHTTGSWLTSGFGLRHVQGRDRIGDGAIRRNTRDDVESRVNLRPTRVWSLGGDLNWETLRYRERARRDRNDRNLDGSLNTSIEPWKGSNVAVIRTYQRQLVSGAESVNDYMRAQMVTRHHVLPEMTATATAARNWVLAQTGASTPSDQLGLRFDGPLRPGANFAIDWTGQALEGVPAAQRYRVAQNIELRLQPVNGVQVQASTQADRLGQKISLRHMDRVYYTVETILSLKRGGSVTMRYDGHQLREQAAGSKYGVSGSVSAPWRWGDAAWSWSAVRASDQDARRGRTFGITSGGSLRVRVSRLWEMTASHTRALPAVGSGSSLWSASLLQRF